jgi:hypothetical protein
MVRKLIELPNFLFNFRTKSFEGEFCSAFRVQYLFVGLLRTKLKEFLDLEHGNHSVLDYTR